MLCQHSLDQGAKVIEVIHLSRAIRQKVRKISQTDKGIAFSEQGGLEIGAGACQKKDILTCFRLDQIIAQFKELLADLVAVLNEGHPLLLFVVHLFREEESQNGDHYRRHDKNNQSRLLVSL